MPQTPGPHTEGTYLQLLLPQPCGWLSSSSDPTTQGSVSVALLSTACPVVAMAAAKDGRVGTSLAVQ